MISLITTPLLLATIAIQSQNQQLNQDKPKEETQKKPDATVIILPRTIPAGSEVRFVVRDGAAYIVLGATGVEIPVPGGGASECLGDRKKATTTGSLPETDKNKEKDKEKDPESEKDKKPTS